MLNVQSIKQRLADLGVDDSVIKSSEIEDLPKFINDDNGEKILYAIRGRYNSEQWLVVCTNEKVLLLNKTFLSDLKDIQIELSGITSVTSSEIFGSTSLDIYCFVDTTFIECSNTHAIDIMVKTINEARENRACKKTIPLPEQNSSLDYQATIIEQNKQIIGLLDEILNELKHK